MFGMNLKNVCLNLYFYFLSADPHNTGSCRVREIPPLFLEGRGGEIWNVFVHGSNCAADLGVLGLAARYASRYYSSHF